MREGALDSAVRLSHQGWEGERLSHHMEAARETAERPWEGEGSKVGTHSHCKREGATTFYWGEDGGDKELVFGLGFTTFIYLLV